MYQHNQLHFVTLLGRVFLASFHSAFFFEKTVNIAVITSATLRFPANQTPLIQVKQESKKRRESVCSLFFLAPPAGLEPATS